ncbi:6-phosphogluconolactonase [Orenia marismortui]|uniref:6-phosphogluconolactonase n=1 Tax=Orenia marismortui TaxID=46469 RepID=UPI0003706932|nr:6-phosphogluconolactonase [Orenia marismortui]
MKTIVDRRADLEKRASKEIINNIEKLLEDQDYINLGIVGGSSVSGIFNHLKDSKLAWDKVHIFMVDERLVPLDSDESNFKLAKESFLDKLIESGKLTEENLHPFIYDSSQKNYGLNKYRKELDKYGGKMDIVILSAGEDGHTASLFPKHQSIKEDFDSYILVDNSPKPPVRRISASKNLILKSRISFLLFFGQKKADAYKSFLDKDISIEECPVKLVKDIDESYIFTDILLD